MTLDHVVIFVHNLSTAAADFRGAGFTVVDGGTHAGGLTRNALVVFANGTYIELLEFVGHNLLDRLGALHDVGMTPWVLRGRTPLDRRFVPRARGYEGMVDFAFAAPDLDYTVANLRRIGVPCDGPHEGVRHKADGTRLAWRMVFPQHERLPFFLQDITPRSHRVPSDTSTVTHANGVVGLATITVCAKDPEALATVYRSVLGSPGQVRPKDELDLWVDDLRLAFTSNAGALAGPPFILGLRGPNRPLTSLRRYGLKGLDGPT